MLSLRVIYAIQILYELNQAKGRGERVTVTELKTRCSLDGSGVSNTLTALRRSGWVNQVNYRHLLNKDLTKSTLYDLVIAMDEEIRLGAYCVMDLWSYRERHKASIDFERQLAGEVAQRLKGVLISDLFPCEKIKPKRSTKQSVQTVVATKVIVTTAKKLNGSWDVN